MEYVYELYHHGVKGMKWGVRRNRKKLGKQISSGLRKTGNALLETYKKQKTKHAEKVAKSKPKRVEDMTDEELNTAIRRLELEKRFKDLTPRTITRGEKFTKSIIDNMIVPVSSWLSLVW